MSKQVKNLQPEKTKGKPSEAPPFQHPVRAEAQQQKTFHQLMENYREFSRKRPQYIKYGLLSIFILPLVFLVLMFSLESKLIFLTLWIVSIIACSAFLIVVEYKDYWYRQLLGIDPPDEKEPEHQADVPDKEDVPAEKEDGKAALHKSKSDCKTPPDHAAAEKADAAQTKAGNQAPLDAAPGAGPAAGEKPKEAEDKKPV